VRQKPYRHEKARKTPRYGCAGSCPKGTGSQPEQTPPSRASWQYSTDGGKTWVDASETLQAKTTVTGLSAGTTIQFRYRSVLKGGASDWSAPLSMVVS